MILRQAFSNIRHDAAVVLRPIENVLNFLFRPLTWEYQLERTLTIDLCDIGRVETEDRDRAGSGSFEKTWRDKPHVIEPRPADHWTQPRTAHAVDYLPEWNGRQQRYAQT